MSEQRNLIIAVILSMGILAGYHYFFEKPASSQIELSQSQKESPGIVPHPQGLTSTTPATREEILALSPRVTIKTSDLEGSLNLRGGKIDDIRLIKYRETVDSQSGSVVLFSPKSAAGAYYASFGWVSSQKEGISLPHEDTLWEADHKILTPSQPVTLKWHNGHGLVFEKKIEVDEQYMFTITEKVINKGTQDIQVHAYGVLARHEIPASAGQFILHEGPLGVFDGRLKEVSYKNMQETPLVQTPSNGGWLGITDKYWLGALIPHQDLRVEASFRNLGGAHQGCQIDVLNPVQTIQAGSEGVATYQLFAGPKVVRMLDEYRDRLGIPRFDLAVDFGWFYFLTKPLFYIMNFLYLFVGNFGVAILILTVLVKLLFFPLANKSYRSMAKMKKLQPEVEKLKVKYEQDKMKMNQELMNLYKKEKVNPLSGCLPIFLQFPVFFALYKVLFVSIEMRHAPFFGWVRDLAGPDSTTLFNLFGLFAWQPPQMLMIGAWPLLMGITMLLQQKMNPQPADPVQAKMFLIMPLLFTYMLAQFPVGLVIYWAWSNILSILQQWMILRLEGKERGLSKG